MHPESLKDQIAGTKRVIAQHERRISVEQSYLRQAQRDLARLEERKSKEEPDLADLVAADARKPVRGY